MKAGLIALLLSLPIVGTVLADSAGSAWPPAGSVSKADGLEAWQRIEAVVTHPRCVNCHVGADNIPMWTISGENKTRPHGMNINAGDSRIGAETVPCVSCHASSDTPNVAPNMPPHVGLPWQLAPVAFDWFEKTGAEICTQLRDPKRNGGRDAAGLVEHLHHDAKVKGFIPWAWVPGPGRSVPPGNFETHVQDMTVWGAAGQPCPE